jgi:aquaporin Z
MSDTLFDKNSTQVLWDSSENLGNSHVESGENPQESSSVEEGSCCKTKEMSCCKKKGKTYELWQRCLAEFAGTAVFVFLILYVSVFNSQQFAQILNGSVAVPSAVLIGLSLATVIMAVGRVSGGHFNPAISLGAIIAERLKPLEGLLYIGSQIVGGFVSCGLFILVLPKPNEQYKELTQKFYLQMAANGYDGATQAKVGESLFGESSPIFTYSTVTIFIVELLMTAIFVAAVLGITKKAGHLITKAIGCGVAIAVAVYIAAPISSGSINPARSIGIAFFANPYPNFSMSVSNISQLWLFVLAPLLGGAIAGLAHLIFGSDGIIAKSASYVAPISEVDLASSDSFENIGVESNPVSVDADATEETIN